MVNKSVRVKLYNYSEDVLKSKKKKKMGSEGESVMAQIQRQYVSFWYIGLSSKC